MNLDRMLNNFFDYVKIETTADPTAEKKPTSPGQLELGKKLMVELGALGLEDVKSDSLGVVTATLPSNLPPTHPAAASVPTIGLLAHMDTSPESSGKNVNPQIHRNYDGSDLVLNKEKNIVINVDEDPDLFRYKGQDIITSDGTTLLGADNKAGIAEIVEMLHHLKEHPEVLHGPVKIAFTTDEELGRGTEGFDVKAFGADFAYTIDGCRVGELDNETFSADLAVFTIHGKVLHPMEAYGRMVNALRIAAAIVEKWPGNEWPETTRGREGFMYFYKIDGGCEQIKMEALVRDFEEDGLTDKEARLKQIVAEVEARFPGSIIDLELKEQYRNMRLKLDEEPRVVEYAQEAMQRVGIEPLLNAVRGGTDGSKLSYEGLLTPNIFVGGHNYHSRSEFIPIQSMEKTVLVLVELVQVWVERSVA